MGKKNVFGIRATGKTELAKHLDREAVLAKRFDWMMLRSPSTYWDTLK